MLFCQVVFGVGLLSRVKVGMKKTVLSALPRRSRPSASGASRLLVRLSSISVVRESDRLRASCAADVVIYLFDRSKHDLFALLIELINPDLLTRLSLP